jgi:RNA polymerase sigma factor (sigma-70 family)
MLSGTDEFEPWMWLVINEGENRLEYNNDQTETRRHYSYSDQNDKWSTLTAEEDVLDKILHTLEKEALKDAIKKLEPQQQELIWDVYYKGLSMADVARRDGVSKMAITNRMNKIIKRLRNILKDF